MQPSSCTGNIQSLLDKSSNLLVSADPRCKRATISGYTDMLKNADDAVMPLWQEETREDDGWFAVVRRLSWDSEFFGFSDARVEPLVSPRCDTVNSSLFRSGKQFGKKLIDLAARNEIAHLVAPVHSGDTLIQYALTSNGFFMADSIATYILDLRQRKSEQKTKCLQVRPACLADIDDLVEAAQACFGDRKYNVNRFNSDPSYAAKSAELYGRWIASSVAGHLVDQVFVYEKESRAVGFITLKKPSPAMIANGLPLGTVVLNAVNPDHQREGIYKQLVQVSLEWFASVGVEFVEIRTQIENTAIHRTWSGLNATLSLTHHTFQLSL